MSTKTRVIRGLDMVGLGPFVPVVRLATGEDPAAQFRAITRTLGVPLLSILVFLGAWSLLAASVETSIGSVPGPVEVWNEAGSLIEDHRGERGKEVEFHERMEVL
jgi:nitrate/nitrite transport system permease protein